MSSTDDLQDVVNCYTTLCDNEQALVEVIDVLNRSCNKDINNFVNKMDIEEPDSTVIVLKTFLYQFAVECVKNFVYNIKDASNNELQTIVISIRELTNDSQVTIEAMNILAEGEQLYTNRVIALCNSFLNSN